ncbi:uncharacterized protein A4U43_C08F26430 [Asparagus officinalis]|uniref:frataxin, mitochondrial n=1 Tax=Asparagus officinalis TaxID=4686 RepID=UPI00098E8593|nr:frataxin, mitochondrial [Asparagus officinalis]ONK61118.1 uncharacterized protein A4U43_C08F26430 [Asparagus officinalis]
MAFSFSRKLLSRRRLIQRSFLSLLEASSLPDPSTCPSKFVRRLDFPTVSRVFFSSNPSHSNEVQGPAAIEYSSILPEEEYHKLADETLHDLQEKFEEYGDEIQLDGFDIDFGNHVLTLKLGNMGTYVINKQTPNRQIWLSSPVSGPSRFDWDVTSQAWVYRRTKANLLQLLEEEVTQLCGKPVSLT